MTRYIRNEPDRKEDVAAAVLAATLAAGLGVVIFYFTRLFLSREPVGETDAGDLHDPDRVED